ncbi:MAG: sodium/proton-translocating pyrophosphatase [Phycisphaeraceae bacterium]
MTMLLAQIVLAGASSTAAASPSGAVTNLPWAYWLAPVGALAALATAFYFFRQIMRREEGDEAMIRVAAAVRAGAYAYLRRQYRIVAIVFGLLVALLLVAGFALQVQPALSALGVPVAGLFSGLCGFFGMKTATSASARTAWAARRSLNDGLRVAFRAGAVMGLCVTGFALLDISLWLLLLTQVFNVGSLAAITTIMLTFAMGASLQALFARVGGGIYTKAADVGADLIGKVEAGIPEDDARNPATIADNVGDNVGDVAGMGADLYESFYGSILASMALAAAAAMQLGLAGNDAISMVVLPPALAGVGILFAIVGIFSVRTREDATMVQLLRALHGGVWLSSAMIAASSGLLLWLLLGGVEHAAVSWWGLWVAVLVGLGAGLVIAWGTEHYTSYDKSPTRRIGRQAETGAATVIIAGLAEGMLSTWVPLLTVVVAILAAFSFAGGQEIFLMGVFGVGIASVGMLATLALTLATDAYGPIADNAGGNAEMTHQPAQVRERTDMLDALGNTTAATGKGFAIGSAALTALALLAAYTVTVQSSLTQQARQAAPAAMVASLDSADAGVQTHYLGHGLFAIQQGDRIDAGLVLAWRDRPEVLRRLAKDLHTTVAWSEPHGMGEATVVANPHGPDLPYQIVPASTASIQQLLAFYDVTLMNPRVLAGLFVGVMLVFVFCAMTMNAVGRAAFAMMRECRRQFVIMKEGYRVNGMTAEQIADPRQWPDSVMVDQKQYPDYATCVAISTAGAQREMILPAALGVFVPIAAGLALGVAGVMGLLAGVLVTGFAVAIFMANAGGAWDNAKKWIETGEMGGKGSDAHKAGVVGDTVGDPFKDTSGPALNILIKLVSIVSVVFAGLIVRFSPDVSTWLGLGG